jgi:hypothetical protein
MATQGSYQALKRLGLTDEEIGETQFRHEAELALQGVGVVPGPIVLMAGPPRRNTLGLGSITLWTGWCCQQALVNRQSLTTITRPWQLPEKSVGRNGNDAARPDGTDLAEMSPKRRRFDY